MPLSQNWSIRLGALISVLLTAPLMDILSPQSTCQWLVRFGPFPPSYGHFLQQSRRWKLGGCRISIVIGKWKTVFLEGTFRGCSTTLLVISISNGSHQTQKQFQMNSSSTLAAVTEIPRTMAHNGSPKLQFISLLFFTL